MATPLEFTVWLKTSKKKPSSPISGEIKVSGTTFNSPPVVKDIVFNDEVKFSNCEFGDFLRFENCEFKAGISLLETDFKGSLHFVDCKIGKNLKNSDPNGLILNRSTIDGSLRFENLVETEPKTHPAILLRNAVIDKEVVIDSKNMEFIPYSIDASGVRVGAGFTIDCPAWSFQEAVDLKNARVNGNVYLALKSVPKIPDKPSEYQRKIRLSNAKITGNMEFNSLNVGGRVALDNALIDGDLIVQGGIAGKKLKIERDFWAPGLQVRGSVTFYAIDIGKKLPDGDNVIDLSGAKISGTLNISYWPEKSDQSPTGVFSKYEYICKIRGNFHCRGISVDGVVNISATRIYGNLSFDAAHLKGGLFMVTNNYKPVTINGDLLLSDLKVKTWIQCSAVHVDGGMMMLASETGPVSFGLGIIHQGKITPEAAIVPCRFGRILIVSCNIDGWLSFPLVQVNGTKFDNDFRGLIINSTNINGDLKLWGFDQFRNKFANFDKTNLDNTFNLNTRNKLLSWEFGASVIGPVKINNSLIKGAVDLSFTKSSGPIEIEDTTINGDLNFHSLLSLWKSLPKDSLSDRLYDEVKKKNSNACLAHRAVAPGVNLRMLTVHNDIDVTGLTVFEDPGNPWCLDYTGMINAQYLQVKGEFLAYKNSGGLAPKDADTAPDIEAHLEVPLELDLRDSNVRELSVSGYSFNKPKPGEDLDNDNGLRLSGGTFGTVSIPTFHRNEQHGGQPVPIDIANIKVDEWIMGEGLTKDEQAGQLKHLLDSSNHSVFRRSTYHTIERYLRNRGNDDEADNTFVSMKKRDWFENIGGNWYYLFGFLIAIGTLILTSYLLLYYFTKTIFFLVIVMIIGFVWDFTNGKVPYYLSPIKFVLHHLNWLILKFGTNPNRLIVVFFLMLVASYPVYRHPANIEASLSRLSIQNLNEDSKQHLLFQKKPLEVFGSSPEGNEWSIGEAIGMTLRYNIPIMGIEFREDWSIRDDSSDKIPYIYDTNLLWPFNSKYCELRSPDEAKSYAVKIESVKFEMDATKHTNPNFRCKSKPKFPVFITSKFSAEDWAEIMVIFNFMILPILLTFLLRKVLKYRQEG